MAIFEGPSRIPDRSRFHCQACVRNVGTLSPLDPFYCLKSGSGYSLSSSWGRADAKPARLWLPGAYSITFHLTSQTVPLIPCRDSRSFRSVSTSRDPLQNHPIVSFSTSPEYGVHFLLASGDDQSRGNVWYRRQLGPPEQEPNEATASESHRGRLGEWCVG